MDGWIIWISIGIILIIAEMFTAGFFLALIGIACLFAGFVALFTNVIFVPFLIFSVISVLLLLLLRPVCLRYFNNKTKPSNVDALIGKECLVDTEVDNDHNRGYVKINADFWKAKSIDGSIIPKGNKVIIRKTEGATVFVERIDLSN